MQRDISINGAKSSDVRLVRGTQRAKLWLDSKPMEAALRPAGEDVVVSVDGDIAVVSCVVERDTVLLHAFGRTWRVAVIDPAERAFLTGNQSDIAKAPMPGVAISVMVKPGDAVTAGQGLLIIESMKMQVEIKSSRAGTIEHVNAREGESFVLGAPLVTLAPLDAGTP